MTKILSIVIPAWNEQERLPPVLEKIRSYCDNELSPNEYEVIVVDDGSRDGTATLVSKFAAVWPELWLISLPENRGKGAAVRTGCVNAHGELVLFYDADGATAIEQEAAMRSQLTAQPNLHLVMGVRYRGDSDVTMTAVRRGLGWLFAFCASRVIGRVCADTQCGFKMFRRSTVQPIVQRCRENGYTFDVELLAAVQRQGLEFTESSIPWTAVSGSKVSLLRDGAMMLWRLISIRLRHMSGAFEPLVAVPDRLPSSLTTELVNAGSNLRSERTSHE